MRKKQTESTPDVRKEHFARLCEQERETNPDAGFTVYQEKGLHALLKEFYGGEGASFEVRLTDGMISPSKREHYGELTDLKTRSARDRYVADVVTSKGDIIEIQTGSLYPLVKKIHFYLCLTDRRVTVVHPVAYRKRVRWVDPRTGEVSKWNRSPKKGSVKDVARELYWMRDYLAEPRFSLCIPLLEMEETRLLDGWGRGGKRGSHRSELRATALCDEVVLSCPQDYADAFLPHESTLPSPFTAAAYAKATGIRGRATYSVLGLLCDLGFLAEGERKGRAKTWVRVKTKKRS